MKIDEALSVSPRTLVNSADAHITYLTGHIEKDSHADYFRLFLNPRNSSMYFRILKSAVVGDVYKFSKDEMQAFGLSTFIPNFSAAIEQTLFQVGIKTGTEVDAVTISTAKVGQFYPPHFTNNMPGSGPSSSMDRKACTCSDKKAPAGGQEDYAPASCSRNYICRSGCQWCNFQGCQCNCTYNNC